MFSQPVRLRTAERCDAGLRRCPGQFRQIDRSRCFPDLIASSKPNPFAAIPSLHAGYPTLVALFVGLRFGGRAWAAVLYPCWAWFSAVYLNHHYIIDLLAGSVYAMIAFLVARTVIVPHLCDRIVDYNVTSRLLLATLRILARCRVNRPIIQVLRVGSIGTHCWRIRSTHHRAAPGQGRRRTRPRCSARSPRPDAA